MLETLGMRLGITIHQNEIFAALIKRRKGQCQWVDFFHYQGKEALKNLRRNFSFFSPLTIVGFPREQTLFKEFSLDPHLNAKEIGLFIQKNILKNLNPSGIFYWDFQRDKSLGSKNRILFVAGEKNKIDCLLKPIRDEGFRIIAVDIDEFAKKRAETFLHALPDPKFMTAAGLALWEPQNEF